MALPQEVPMSHEMLGQGMRGGLQQAMPQMPSQGMPPPMGGSGLQQSNMALQRESQDDNRAQISDAYQTAQAPYQQQAEQMRLNIQKQLAEGLPSMQEARRAADATRANYIETLAPREFSGMDNLMAGMGAALDPRLFERGNTGAALAAMGRGSMAARKDFDSYEIAKAKAANDTQEAAYKDRLGEAKLSASAMGMGGRGGAGGVGDAEWRPIQLKDKTWVSFNKRTNETRPLAITDQAAVQADYDTYYKFGGKHLDTDDHQTLHNYALAQIDAKANLRAANPQMVATDPSGTQMKPLTPQTVSAQPQAQGAQISAPDAGIPVADKVAVRGGVGEVMSMMTPDDQVTMRKLVDRVNTPGSKSMQNDTVQIEKLLMKYQTPDAAAPSTQGPQFAMRNPAEEARRKVFAEENEKAAVQHYAKDIVTGSDVAESTLNNLSILRQVPRTQDALAPWREKLGSVVNALGLKGDLVKEAEGLQSVRSILTKIANDRLVLAKGVQTEGDAQRAFEEFAKIDDTQAAADFMYAWSEELAHRAKAKRVAYDQAKEETKSHQNGDKYWQKTDYAQAAPVALLPDGRGGSKAWSFTEWKNKFAAANPDASNKDVITQWNNLAGRK